MSDTILLVGIVTMYTIEDYGGLPLFCPPYLYNDASPGWIALNAELYHRGIVECGDPIDVVFDSGEQMRLLALDAAPLDRYCIENGVQCVPIVGDIPELHWTQPYIGAQASVRFPRTHRRFVTAKKGQHWL